MTAHAGFVRIESEHAHKAVEAVEAAQGICPESLHVWTELYETSVLRSINWLGRLYGDLARRCPQFNLVPALQPDADLGA